MLKRKFLFSSENSLYFIQYSEGSWQITKRDFPYEVRTMASDFSQEGRLYAGTFEHGLWISEDFGKEWTKVEEGINFSRVLSVAVSEIEKYKDYHVVWVGTEPSRLYRSEDGGKTWQERRGLLALPSKSSWQFPPRPYTHHVKAIQPDIHNEERLFVGIELGGVMKSEDRGITWEDRKKDSQFDCHNLTMALLQKDRLYETAGGGFAETVDGGATWKTINEGLGPYTYLVDIAVDRANPHTIVVSGAKNARTAYMPERAHTIIARKVKGKPWQIVETGLPNRNQSTVYLLQADPEKDHTFYAVNNRGLYESTDAGLSWNRFAINWPGQILSERIHSFLII